MRIMRTHSYPIGRNLVLMCCSMHSARRTMGHGLTSLARGTALIIAAVTAATGCQQSPRPAMSLDAAKQALGDDTKDEGEMDEGDHGRPGADHFEIPDKQKGPEEFRRRVLKGLSEPASNKDKDAITRYAEGLLR